MDIAQNTIQTLNSTGTYAAILNADNDFTVQGNNTWGGIYAFDIVHAGSGTNVVTQNAMHNCGYAAIALNNLASSAVQITNNVFGECGLFGISSVILVTGVGADASGANTFVQNNSYQGHLNFLGSYVNCTFTAPHIPASHVTGNTQTQTALSNII